MNEVMWIIICWILTFVLYGILRMITNEYMERYRRNQEERERKEDEEREKEREKGPSKTKEKINA